MRSKNYWSKNQLVQNATSSPNDVVTCPRRKIVKSLTQKYNREAEHTQFFGTTLNIFTKLPETIFKK